MKEFNGSFELFGIDVKRSLQGNKLKVVFKMEEDKAIEKKLIDFRDDWVLLTVNQKIPQESIGEIVSVSGKFVVREIKCRSSRNGCNLFLILDQDYEKEKELEFVNLRFQEVIINMIPTEPNLPFEDEKNDINIDDVELPDEIDIDKIVKKVDSNKKK